MRSMLSWEHRACAEAGRVGLEMMDCGTCCSRSFVSAFEGGGIGGRFQTICRLCRAIGISGVLGDCRMNSGRVLMLLLWCDVIRTVQPRVAQLAAN